MKPTLHFKRCGDLVVKKAMLKEQIFAHQLKRNNQMKNLKQISEELPNKINFCEVADEWIGENQICWYKNRLESRGHILIATKDEDGYSLYRFFQLGISWVCSCDVNCKSLDVIFDRLVNLYEQ